MRRIRMVSVELRRTTDFLLNPGAQAFIDKYKKYQSGFSYFEFDLEQPVWKEAQDDLDKFQLEYTNFYKLELENKEIKNYPVFNLIVPSLYKLVTPLGQEKFELNKKELRTIPIAEDFDSGLMVIETGVYELLERFAVSLEIINKNSLSIKNKDYKITGQPQEMQIPMIIPKADSIKENAGNLSGTYYPIKADDRFDLSKEGIEFVQNNHLVRSTYFEFSGKVYKKQAPNYLISGALAAELKKLLKKAVQFTPLSLKAI